MPREVEIVHIPVSPDRATELIVVLEAARTGYLGPPACEHLEVLVTQARDEIAAVVVWRSPQAHAEAQRSPRAAEFFQAVAALASGKPGIKSYQPGGPGA